MPNKKDGTVTMPSFFDVSGIGLAQGAPSDRPDQKWPITNGPVTAAVAI